MDGSWIIPGKRVCVPPAVGSKVNAITEGVVFPVSYVLIINADDDETEHDIKVGETTQYHHFIELL